MVTIKNKFVLLAAGFWFVGILLLLLGAWARKTNSDAAGTLLTLGILGQAAGFGFLGFAIMQSVLKKK
ncbi:hypothetical protein [Spirosoma agri]|uniref:Uncharacterized protein n=1 Tax=Spirosoma agri TaxID=1987381 RepID=A0A6M0IF14_9BACT|nr:hypothetical protein [Spirosoma agri]NEU65653.1 hypothetical protein [Spirosoma agri]